MKDKLMCGLMEGMHMAQDIMRRHAKLLMMLLAFLSLAQGTVFADDGGIESIVSLIYTLCAVAALCMLIASGVMFAAGNYKAMVFTVVGAVCVVLGPWLFVKVWTAGEQSISDAISATGL